MNAKLLGAILGGMAFSTVAVAHAEDAPKTEKKAEKKKGDKKDDKKDEKKGDGEKSCGGEKGCGGDHKK